jgi:hypothetical protein
VTATSCACTPAMNAPSKVSVEENSYVSGGSDMHGFDGIDGVEKCSVAVGLLAVLYEIADCEVAEETFNVVKFRRVVKATGCLVARTHPSL